MSRNIVDAVTQKGEEKGAFDSYLYLAPSKYAVSRCALSRYTSS